MNEGVEEEDEEEESEVSQPTVLDGRLVVGLISSVSMVLDREFRCSTRQKRVHKSARLTQARAGPD